MDRQAGQVAAVFGLLAYGIAETGRDLPSYAVVEVKISERRWIGNCGRVRDRTGLVNEVAEAESEFTGADKEELTGSVTLGDEMELIPKAKLVLVHV
ncbi:hypothetical protein GGTG_07549 [Gaeumannomyces tritici R3-111a-1]|uniref:Uncharacterized protein n=1 Tax=Gaeumannomyces tritici (strain R3-111a-1) TaxID=644352 RepID=J3P201_GAET3|nr:hypothetical protein GGTG_07549 [Gaeumannomyces tritici R3-111a-1]EJT73693.1 hypothetical protein GGTG_07549 [Gaeumannomyces tritici R3-111a-1]